jgi:hypothetical protein
MKNLSIVLFLALAVVSGCPKPIPGPNTPDAADGGSVVTPGGAFSACTSDAVKKTAEGLLGKVATALATGDYTAQITSLVNQFGAAEVKCAVQLFVDSLTRKAKVDQLAAQQLANGNAWLKAQGL